MTPLLWAIVACWAVFMAVWGITSLQAKASVRRPLSPLALFARLAVIVAAIILSRAMARGLLPRLAFPYGVMLVGLALTILGVGFAIWARLTLGRNWGMPMTLRENPELVTRGPYALVRHPIYTGMLCAMLGTALAVGGWWFAVFAIGCGYFAVSVRREERDMLERFPEGYPAYRARTRMLIPFVY